MVRVFALCLLQTTAWADVSLKGTHSSQERENAEADRAGLVRIEDDTTLERMKRNGELMKIPNERGVKVDPRLLEKWAWVRGETATFLSDLGRDFDIAFGRPFLVSSAVRTMKYQWLLRFINGNAAAVNGSRRSTHPTGATIDITKLPLTENEIAWLRVRLLALEEAGVIQVTEEFHQSVFHVMVFSRYVSYAANLKAQKQGNSVAIATPEVPDVEAEEKVESPSEEETP